MVRPLTKQIWDSIHMDEWPGLAAGIDFALEDSDHQERYEALYYPIRAGEITIKELDAALGDGPKLTELVNKCKSNPHKGIVFETS